MTSPEPLVTQATFAEMMALEAHGPDTFVGVGPSYPWGGLYGGQIVAQSLRAAGLTVDEGFRPHSLHAYFIRRGDASEPIRFEVDRIRNGRSFTTRRVVARQSGGAIFNLAASFQVVEDAVDVQKVTMDPAVGAPDDHASDGWSHVFDRRVVFGMHPSPVPGRAAAWMQMSEPVPDDALLRACALAYMSDDLPTEAVFTDHPDLVVVGPESGDEDSEGPWSQFMNASLDHCIWFHRDIDPARWHVHDLRSQGLVGSRGLAVGELVSADGVHAATITQEVLVRRIR